MNLKLWVLIGRHLSLLHLKQLSKFIRKLQGVTMLGKTSKMINVLCSHVSQNLSILNASKPPLNVEFITVGLGFRVLSLKSTEITLCNLNRWEHGKLGLITSHGVPMCPKSQLWHGCLHGNTFWRWGLGLVLKEGLSKKSDPTLNTSPANIFAWKKNKDSSQWLLAICTWFLEAQKVGTSPPCWDLLTWVGLGTWDPMWTGPYCHYIPFMVWHIFTTLIHITT